MLKKQEEEDIVFDLIQLKTDTWHVHRLANGEERTPNGGKHGHL